LPGMWDALLLPGLGAWEATPSQLLWVAAMIHTGDCLEVMRTFAECLSVGGAE
jgi:hypothetical protein